MAPRINERVGQTCLVPIPTGYLASIRQPHPTEARGFLRIFGGNELPGAPPFTVSWGAQIHDTAHARIGQVLCAAITIGRIIPGPAFSTTIPMISIRGYTNLNLTLIFTNQDGWRVMLYDKNVFDATAITGVPESETLD